MGNGGLQQHLVRRTKSEGYPMSNGKGKHCGDERFEQHAYRRCRVSLPTKMRTKMSKQIIPAHMVATIDTKRFEPESPRRAFKLACETPLPQSKNKSRKRIPTESPKHAFAQVHSLACETPLPQIKNKLTRERIPAASPRNSFQLARNLGFGEPKSPSNEHDSVSQFNEPAAECDRSVKLKPVSQSDDSDECGCTASSDHSTCAEPTSQHKNHERSLNADEPATGSIHLDRHLEPIPQNTEYEYDANAETVKYTAPTAAAAASKQDTTMTISGSQTELRVSGVKGPFSDRINGVYLSPSHQADKTCSRRVVYYQHNDNKHTSDEQETTIQYDNLDRWIVVQTFFSGSVTRLLAYSARSKLADPTEAEHWFIRQSLGNLTHPPVHAGAMQ